MKKSIKLIIGFLLICFQLVLLITPLSASSAVSNQSTSLEIYVQAQNVEDVYGVQLDMSYDTSLLEFVEAEPELFGGTKEDLKQGKSLWNNGQKDIGMQSYSVNNGKVTYIATQLGQGDVISGQSVSLVKFRFNIIGNSAGISGINVSNTKIVRLDNDILSEATLNDVSIINAE